MGPFRQTDAVLTITQDNARHAIEITASNETASEIIGFAPEELKGKAFKELLPIKIAEMLDDYVEFEQGANDVGEVLRKVRDFQLKGKNGKHMPFRLKIVRHHSQTLDEFMLIMQDEDRQRENESFMNMLHENFQGHAALNPDTDLPDRSSLLKGLELVELHREHIPNGLCIAVFEMDAYEEILSKQGINACHKVMQSIAATCQQNLRGNDVVAQMDRHRLAIILIGAKKEPAKIVLNRLRWLVAGQSISLVPGIDVRTTVTVLYKEIDGSLKPEALLERFEKAYEQKPAESLNLVAEA